MMSVTTSVKHRTTKPKIEEFEYMLPEGANVDEHWIGQGNFSKVFKVRHKETKEIFALKTMDKSHVKRLQKRHPNIMNEIQMEKDVLLNHLKTHPNIIPLYHTFQDHANLYFLMEYLSGGELWSQTMCFENQVGMDEDRARFYAMDIVNGMEFMHSKGIIHRDLKTENMVLSEETGHLKIVDFGTAKNLIDTKFNGPHFVGTPEYMSPETVKNQSVDTMSDLWAFGCILYQLLCGVAPFAGGSAYLSFLNTKEGDFHFPSFVSQEAKDLISRLLVQHPLERIKIPEIKVHPFFQGQDFEKHAQVPPPLPRLQYLCIRRLTDTLRTYSNDQNKKNNKKSTLSLISLKGTRSFEHIKNLCERMHILHRPEIHALFHAPSWEHQFHFAQKRGILGLDQTHEGQWKDSYYFIYVANIELGRRGSNDIETEAASLRQFISTVNEMQPAPRFLLLSGNKVAAEYGDEQYEDQIACFKECFAGLKPSIRLVMSCGSKDVGETEDSLKDALVKYREAFGEDFFAFWVGGVKYIVLNTNLYVNADKKDHETQLQAQTKWLTRELEFGKICASSIVVAGHHSFYSKAENNETHELNNDMERPCLVPEKYRAEHLKLFQESMVQMVLSSSGHKNEKVFLPSTQKNPGSEDGKESIALQMLSTLSLNEDSIAKTCGIRVIKVSPAGLQENIYSLPDLPQSIELLAG